MHDILSEYAIACWKDGPQKHNVLQLVSQLLVLSKKEEKHRRYIVLTIIHNHLHSLLSKTKLQKGKEPHLVI